MFQQPQLRQLKQRVGLRCNLLPLEFKEVDGYIRRRLELAGANADKDLFSKEAVEAIYFISKGIPRLVNTLCENSLMLGYGLQVRQITPAIVKEVAADFRLDQATAAPPAAAEGTHGPTIGLKLLNRKEDEGRLAAPKQTQKTLFHPEVKSE